MSQADTHLLSFMQRELARALRDAAPVGIVLVDVDHFKKVNDEFGHETGDCVLKEITKRLSASLREYDGIRRYGGEEFLLVIPGVIWQPQFGEPIKSGNRFRANRSRRF